MPVGVKKWRARHLSRSGSPIKSLLRSFLSPSKRWRVFLASAVALVLLGLVVPAVGVAASLLVGVASVAALARSARRKGPHRVALGALSVGVALTLASALVRLVTRDQADWTSLAPEVFGLPAFALLTWAPFRMSRDTARPSDKRRSVATAAVLDGALIVVGAAACVITLMVLPNLAEMASVDDVIYAFYPLLDAGMVFALVYLAFVSTPGLCARRLILLAAVSVYGGDIAQAWNVANDTESAWASAPYVIGIAALGAAALHPSVDALGFAQERYIRSWTAPRVAIMAAGLCAPALLMIANPNRGPEYRITYAAAIILSAALVLTRAVHAVNAFARTHAALELQAERDPLTQLANRTGFLARAQAMLDDAAQRGGTVSALFIDLDGFKAVNDTRGHAAGDALLVAVAQRLSGALRQEDVAARLGGDEFALVTMDDEHGSIGERLSERIHALFAEPFEAASLRVPIRAAVGMANSAQIGNTASVAPLLVGAADAAMYDAKRAGSTRWVRAGEASNRNGDNALVWSEPAVTAYLQD